MKSTLLEIHNNNILCTNSVNIFYAVYIIILSNIFMLRIEKQFVSLMQVNIICPHISESFSNTNKIQTLETNTHL